MAENRHWSIPAPLQPQAARLDYDLDAALDAMVLLRAEIPEQAFTASVLGTERQGYGAVIRADGLVLTIGYLITEAQSIWLTSNRGVTVPAHPLAVDFVSGFGLVLPLLPLVATPLARAATADLAVGDAVSVLGHGGRDHAIAAKVVARQEFAGYWEYVLDEALFTAPAHPQWGGAACLNQRGELVSIGSLFVQEAVGGRESQANMSVPVDLLEPVLDDLIQQGRRPSPARPWLGMYVQQHDDDLVVAATAADGPADRAGIEPGDVVTSVAGQPVADLAALFRQVWAQGPAGTEIVLSVRRDGAGQSARVKSIDREATLYHGARRN